MHRRAKAEIVKPKPPSCQYPLNLGVVLRSSVQESKRKNQEQEAKKANKGKSRGKRNEEDDEEEEEWNGWSRKLQNLGLKRTNDQCGSEDEDDESRRVKRHPLVFLSPSKRLTVSHSSSTFPLMY